MAKLLLGVVLIGTLALAYVFGPSLLRSTAPESATAASPIEAKPGDVRVEVTEAALTERLNQRLAGQSLGSTPLGAATLKSIEARLRTGQMQFDGNAQVAGRDVPLSLSSKLDVEDGRPVVNVHEARAAGVPMLEPARESIEDVLQQQVDQEVKRMSLRVRSVTIADGKLTMIGSKAP